VLILDIAMPDENGYTVLKKVRALNAARPFRPSLSQPTGEAKTGCARSRRALVGPK
jgi:DNA-binding response OmpR family regulator